MSAAKWCCGYRRPPHVPTGGLVTIDAARGVRLCKDQCWTRWVRDDRKANE